MTPENMRRFGKYQLVELRDSGATSKVWKAFDPQLKRYVAIKVLHADQQTESEVIARFEREAQAIASLHHPNIVQVHELQLSLQNPSDIYMIMDYIEGDTLREYIKKTSRQGNYPTYAELVRLFTSIAMAVDYAHLHGMIHRDIKPANILLDANNRTRNTMGEPMLVDFGLAKITGISTGTLQGQVLGTPLYMAPEQALGGAISAYSDIYSLGVILYEMCTGRLPFRADGQAELFLKHINDRPPLPRSFNPQISDALQDVILCCLAKNPSQRYPSASALVLALARALSLPPPLELVSNASGEEQVQQQSVQQREPVRTQPDAPQPPPLFAREQAEQIPATLRSINGAGASIAPVLSAHAPVRKVPNPETPLPPVDTMASLFPASQSLSQPSVVVHPSINNPVPPKRPKAHRRRRIGILLIALLLLMIISALTWAILPKFEGKSPDVATASVGQVVFFSTDTADTQGKVAVNDGIQAILKLAPLASGDSYYGWLRSTGKNDTPLSLNALSVKNGVASLYYVDSQHRNLLGPVGNNGDFYYMFVVTEQQTTNSPSLEGGTSRYQAAFPTQPSSKDGRSYMDHLHHLLSSDPDLDKLLLNGGLNTLLLGNVRELYYLTEGIANHANLGMVKPWLITSIYYLDGKCAVDDVNVANRNLFSQQDLQQGRDTLRNTQISLLDCSLTGTLTPNRLSYINHIQIHLNGIMQAPGATATEKQEVAAISVTLQHIKAWLTQVKQDALTLIAMPALDTPTAVQYRHDMEINAELAMMGKLDPSTQQMEQGASLMCDSIQQLASMSVTKV